MNTAEFGICKIQQELYEYAAKQDYDMEKFSDFFLQSAFCAELFDKSYQDFRLSETIEECMNRILAESGELPKIDDSKEEYDCCKDEFFKKDRAGFVGMIYRMLYFITPYSSKELCKKAPYSKVWKYYFATPQEPEDFIAESICIDLNIEYDEDNALVKF